jgi:hypothetical protein
MQCLKRFDLDIIFEDSTIDEIKMEMKHEMQ